MKPLLRAIVVFALIQAAGTHAAGTQEPVLEQILSPTGSARIAGEPIFNRELLRSLYARRGFQRFWPEEAVQEAVLHALRTAVDDGLDPADYHTKAIHELLGSPPSVQRSTRLDVLRVDGFLRLAYDLRFGRIDEPTLTVRRLGSSSLGARAQLVEIESLLTGSGSPAVALASLRPTHFVYRGLVDALASLRRVEDAGGWLTLPPGPGLREGMIDSGVPRLRARLSAEGYVVGTPAPEDVARFDSTLTAAVRLFQHRHGLNEDGVVGRATLAELNVPVESRIVQLRVNLERARWATRNLPHTFVAVNVAGAKLYFVRNDSVVFETRVVVGRTYTRTPLFNAPMQYIDLNPSWSVPRSIVPEVIAAARRDPEYLQRNGFHVSDVNGRAVPLHSIKNSGAAAYTFVQSPGSDNALGHIKLVFPNRYNVYLHDTPSHQLFERDDRTFSHGCIRVQEPVALAALVLDDSLRWSRAALEAAIERGRRDRIPLRVPVRVAILYWTASADLHGELHYYRDPYGRDSGLRRALVGNSRTSSGRL
jgi:L,D-transpeptidase YcbB